MFQSAPCTEVQGDTCFIEESTCGAHVSIRSLHRSTGRSGTQSAKDKVSISFVSIRSLHRSTGRWYACPSGCALKIWFQSAPCTEVQGDVGRNTKFPPTTQVSIRSLHRSTGRLAQRSKGCRGNFTFSIRSLHRSTGRSLQLECNPLPAIQGDCLLRFNPLPAPKYREMLVAVTSVIPKGYTSRCANPLSYASFD